MIKDYIIILNKENEVEEKEYLNSNKKIKKKKRIFLKEKVIKKYIVEKLSLTKCLMIFIFTLVFFLIYTSLISKLDNEYYKKIINIININTNNNDNITDIINNNSNMKNISDNNNIIENNINNNINLNNNVNNNLDNNHNDLNDNPFLNINQPINNNNNPFDDIPNQSINNNENNFNLMNSDNNNFNPNLININLPNNNFINQENNNMIFPMFPSSSNNINSSLNIIKSNFLDEDGDFGEAMTFQQIDNLPIINFPKKENYDEKCPLCEFPFYFNDRVTKLENCQHTFHK